MTAIEQLLEDAKCIQTCIPPGMQGAVLIALLNQIVSAGIGGGLAGSGSPEGFVTANPGATYWDQTGKSLWVKDSGTGNTGWEQIIA